MHVFPLDSRQRYINRLPTDTLSETRFAKIIGANQAEKRAHSLLNCISVTDDTEINEQDKSITTGLIYVQPKFDAFSTLVHGEMLNSNPLG